MSDNTLKTYLPLDEVNPIKTFPPSIAGSGNLDSSNTPLVYSGRDLIVKNYGFVTKKGFIIFLDALGMKGIWKRIHPMEVIRKWSTVTNEFILLEDKIQNFEFYYRALSDTIIIVLSIQNRDPIFSDLAKIFSMLMKPFLVGLQNRILFRGVISWGLIYWSEKLILGEAIDDAAYYHDKLNWIGISTSPKLNLNNQIYHNKDFISYNIPVKDTQLNTMYIPGLVLNWPFYDPREKYDLILRDEERKADMKAKIKYNHTNRFYKYCKTINQHSN